MMNFSLLITFLIILGVKGGQDGYRMAVGGYSNVGDCKTVQNCVLCLKNNTICDKCLKGYFVLKKLCEECSPGCSSCEGQRGCTKCMSGYRREKSKLGVAVCNKVTFGDWLSYSIGYLAVPIGLVFVMVAGVSYIAKVDDFEEKTGKKTG